MTFDAAVATTWGGALADLRDKVGGMTNWSIEVDKTEKYDSTGDDNLDAWRSGTSVEKNGRFVLGMPTGESVEFEYATDQGNGGLRMKYGPDFDAANDTWNQRYSNDPNNKYYDKRDSGYEKGTSDLLAPMAGGNSVNPTDDVTYWLAYSDAVGFAFYVERTAGDGNDADIAIGFSQVDKTWDYTAASGLEAEYTYLFTGGQIYDSASSQYGSTNWGYDRAVNDFNVMAESGNINDTGFGEVNPDSMFANYPLTTPHMQSSSYRNTAGNDAIVGTHDLWVNDKSGQDSAHRDTVQDSGGSNLYTLLKSQKCHVGFKMI